MFVFCLSKNVHHCQSGWKRHKRMMLYKLLDIEHSRKVYELFIIFQGETTIAILSVLNIITFMIFCSDRSSKCHNFCLCVRPEKCVLEQLSIFIFQARMQRAHREQYVIPTEPNTLCLVLSTKKKII